MNIKSQNCFYAENNISKTGFRALFLFLKLLESPKTREELITLLSEDKFFRDNVSKDTITIVINTLKKVGCLISRPNKKTNNCYVLKTHPFNIQFTEENVLALQALRENIITLNDFDLLVHLNNLYFKIAHFAPTEELKNLLLYKHPLNNLDYKILNELVIYSSIKKQTNICYDSPQNGQENLDFFPETFSFENGKIYIWGYCAKYNNISFLRVDRIKKVNLVTFSAIKEINENFMNKPERIQYKLKGYSANLYIKNEDEKIILEDMEQEYPLVIECCTNNKFNFFQRILSYGLDCKIVSPSHVQEEFLGVIKTIKEGYLIERN